MSPELRDEDDNASFRRAEPDDAGVIAQVHTESWRRNYRGAYADAYLDGDLYADRLRLWSQRLAITSDDRCTFAAVKSGALVGFAHLALDADPFWGALIDNLHVSYESQGGGIGTQLLAAAACWVHERRGDSGIFLWVLKQNVKAQRFYLSRGARLDELALVPPPDGDPRSLTGTPLGLRVVWTDGNALKRLRGRERCASRSDSASSANETRKAVFSMRLGPRP